MDDNTKATAAGHVHAIGVAVRALRKTLGTPVKVPTELERRDLCELIESLEYNQHALETLLDDPVCKTEERSV